MGYRNSQTRYKAIANWAVGHRAQDRFRAAGCPEDVHWAILGHEKETVAAGYGEVFPMPLD